MTEMPAYMTPKRWIETVFAAQAVNRGGVIQRRKRDVERYAGLEKFQHEVARRGFQIIENNEIYIILCNAAPVRFVVRADPSMDRSRSVDRSTSTRPHADSGPPNSEGRSLTNRPPMAQNPSMDFSRSVDRSTRA